MKSIKKLFHIIIPLIAVYLYENMFKKEVDFYINLIPKTYHTIGLILLLILCISSIFFKKKQTDKNTLLIATENDYQRTYVSYSAIVLPSIFLFFYAILISIKNFDFNTIFTLLIIITLGIKGTFLRKTSSFKIDKRKLFFERKNEKRTFSTQDIQEIKIAPYEITIHYNDSEKLISFLELKQDDFKEIKTWFQKRLPYITVSKVSL
ncbi:conserved membrane hypothetical protein [Tenacibaculum sp. 190524A02b]|uniref:Uncharacterized protein n=1 Tax=Tenacibaculum vairaonense TaxID=3137860 RepID=A0ABM9PH09_9FLAO